MTVRRNKARGFWMIDIDYRPPSGKPDRVRKKATVQDKRGAMTEERLIRQALLDGTYRRKGDEKETPTLTEFEAEFIAYYAEANNKPSEVVAKLSIYKHHLVPFFGKLKLNDIGPRELERFKACKIKDGLKPATVNNALTVLRKTLTVAQEWRIIEHVPQFKWLKKPPTKFVFFDFEEAARLLNGADPKWRTMITTALNTGMRIGELLALHWEDVDLVRKRLVVRRNLVKGTFGTPKSGRNREIDLNDTLLALLKEHRHLKGELVFCDEAGQPLNREKVRPPLLQACKQAGLQRIGWHVLRHTFASHLAMNRVPAKAIQELMGHSTLETTNRYMHLSPDSRRDAVKTLDISGNMTATRGDRVSNNAE